LETDADRIGQGLLRHAKGPASQSDALAQCDIEGMRLIVRVGFDCAHGVLDLQASF
jgi:hypothetical protein